MAVVSLADDWGDKWRVLITSAENREGFPHQVTVAVMAENIHHTRTGTFIVNQAGTPELAAASFLEWLTGYHRDKLAFVYHSKEIDTAPVFDLKELGTRVLRAVQDRVNAQHPTT